MNQPSKKRGSDTVGASKDAVQNTTTLLLTMADTTWRVFVPTILFVGLGIWADLQAGTKPWLTFLGLAIGLIVASFLIRAQIKKVQR
jgi:F0F1-type ATP synthase assembly protein I